MRLRLLAGSYAVCRGPAAPRPRAGELVALLADGAGWTWVGPEDGAPGDMECRTGWRALEVEGPLDFGLTGVLAALTAPLAQAGLPVFALSTWATDFLLVPGARLAAARAALAAAGHELTDAEDPG